MKLEEEGDVKNEMSCEIHVTMKITIKYLIPT